jgi:hypothetical protein
MVVWSVFIDVTREMVVWSMFIDVTRERWLYVC